MRRLLVAAAIVHVGGCDVVFRLDHIEAGSADARHDGVTSDGLDETPRCDAAFDELFSDGEPCTPWATVEVTNAAIHETSLGLVITPIPLMQGSRGGCFGNAGYPFGKDGVMVEVDDVVTGTDAYTTLEFTADIALGVTDGMLVLSNNAGTDVLAQLAYLPADMRWWRILPNNDRSGIEAQYSADGLAWSQLTIAPFVVPATVTINVQAGFGTDSPGSGKSVFRRLTVCR